MPLRNNFNSGWVWKVRRLVDVSEEFRELLGEEVLGLVGGRVRKMGEEKTYPAVKAPNAGDAVKAYILDCLDARDGAGDLDVSVMVVRQKLTALAEFEVLKPDGLHEGFYQASIMIGDRIG